MFRNLAKLVLPNPPEAVFRVHPLQLSRWLDEAWDTTALVPAFGPASGKTPFLGDPNVIGLLDLPTLTGAAVAPPVPSGLNPANVGTYTGNVFTPPKPLFWDHLIYAFLIESTGIVEIFAEVLRRFAVGETLNFPDGEAIQWARATEELFYRDPPLFSITGIASELRPSQRVARRNEYWRMFGLDLPHSIPSRWAPMGTSEPTWKADTGDGVNREFRDTWGELLHQIWLGIENARNGIGPNATDREYIALLIITIRDMFAMRRRRGQLAREEFVHVSFLAWYHLTVETDTPIVRALKADASDPANRLSKIADLVGMKPAARSRELFQLADLMSGLLRAIEVGVFDLGPQAETLYLPLPGGTNAQLLSDMNLIIDLWQSATGDDVKARRVSTRQAGSAQPIRIPTPTSPVAPQPAGATAGGSAGPSLNGRG